MLFLSEGQFVGLWLVLGVFVTCSDVHWRRYTRCVGCVRTSVRKIAYITFSYLIYESFRSVRKLCSCCIIRYTNRIAKLTSRRWQMHFRLWLFQGRQPKKSMNLLAAYTRPKSRVPALLLTKKSRTFQDPHKNFSRLFRIYLQYSESSPLQKIQHEAKCGRHLCRIQMNLSTCFPFKPLENAWLSRIFLQDLLGPKICKKKILDFAGGVETLEEYRN